MTKVVAAPDLGEPIASEWRAWGPYLSEREWGTVREDYSESGTAWDFFPHDQACSRAYRWGKTAYSASPTTNYLAAVRDTVAPNTPLGGCLYD